MAMFKKSVPTLKFKILIIFIFVCGWATGCFWPQAAAAQTVLVIPKGVMFSFWQSVCVGASDAAQENGVEMIWRGPRVENKVEAQQYILDMYVDRSVDAVVVAPSHASRLNGAIERAVAKGTEVVVIDSPVTTTAMSSYISTENYEAGRLGAELLLKDVQPKAKVLLMGNVPGNASTDRREQGFVDYMKENAPHVSIITTHFNEGTYTSAMYAAEHILSSTRDLDGVFAVNEVSSVAVLDWFTIHPESRVPFIAFDHSSKLEEGLVAGAIDSIIAQSPYLMGYLGVEAATQAIQGKKLEKRVVSPTFVISRKSLGNDDLMKKVRISPEHEQRYPGCFK